VSDEIDEDEEKVKDLNGQSQKIPLLERLTKMYGAM